MNRRESIRQAVLLAFGMMLGKYDVHAQASGAAVRGSKAPLTVDLNQWHSIVFTLGKKTIAVPVAEVFAALAAGPGDTE